MLSAERKLEFDYQNLLIITFLNRLLNFYNRHVNIMPLHIVCKGEEKRNKKKLFLQQKKAQKNIIRHVLPNFVGISFNTLQSILENNVWIDPTIVRAIILSLQTACVWGRGLCSFVCFRQRCIKIKEKKEKREENSHKNSNNIMHRLDAAVVKSNKSSAVIQMIDVSYLLRVGNSKLHSVGIKTLHRYPITGCFKWIVNLCYFLIYCRIFLVNLD